MQEQLNFFKVALEDLKIGAMTRSSKYVVETVMENVNGLSLSRVIEYGPGDGVVTREILKKMPKNGELIAIETNPKFVDLLKKIDDPWIKIISGTAQEISEKLKKDYRADINLVVSSIPFSILSPADKVRVVRNTYDLLKDHGRFIVFQYSPILLKLLGKYFNKHKIKTQFEFRNVPPMFIMSAQK